MGRVGLRLIDQALGCAEPSSLSPEVEWLRRQLVGSNGRARVEPLMDETGWSRRHVTERFRRQLGVPPKAYARLLRFEHASSLLADRPGGRSLAEVAIEAGYYDQSHLTREFVTLAGMSPGVYSAELDLAPEVRFVQDWRHHRPCRVEPMSTVDSTTAPPASTTVIPVLVYEDIEAAHDFLVGTFGLASGDCTASTTAPSCTPRCATVTPPSGCTP